VHTVDVGRARRGDRALRRGRVAVVGQREAVLAGLGGGEGVLSRRRRRVRQRGLLRRLVHGRPVGARRHHARHARRGTHVRRRRT